MFAKSLLAIATLALSVAASPVQIAGTSEAALLERSLVPEFIGLDKRESRSQAYKRIAVAKQRAARKAKRALDEKENHQLFERAVAQHQGESGVSKRDLEARELSVRALRNVRCGISDSVCSSAALPSDIPANGLTKCSQSKHRCIISCKAGFQYRGGVCVASATTCGTNTCGSVDNGIFLCGAGAKCYLFCDSANGYASNASKTACIAKSVDVDNCGTEGNVCPSSYNGVGVATCRASKCRLTCPVGTFQQTTSTGLAFCGN
ncbi:hypothetical protein BCR35DRAFT_304233 [Leucosporidium creatinivorum]|uniref:Uncharacterized protein n=1 Tax=Leucosporidium creatinivorum TaxID=106004 RepID=A0A1Y2FCV5_9BASI|nr:hypothetical protein BCR35DRAFT_304233 [Leucosporidium creatinivorum]